MTVAPFWSHVPVPLQAASSSQSPPYGPFPAQVPVIGGGPITWYAEAVGVV